MESLCNTTLLLQDGSQITAFGQETIGGQIGIIHPEVVYKLHFTWSGCEYKPNVFFMSCLLFIGTYLIATALKAFKSQRFLPNVFRSYISSFAVIIAIVIMVVVDLFFAVETPKLNVPSEFSPTWEGRGENILQYLFLLLSMTIL